jgi:hypothetical protein
VARQHNSKLNFKCLTLRVHLSTPLNNIETSNAKR